MTRLHHFAFGFTLALCAAFAATPNAAFALGSTPVTVTNPADIAKSEGIQHPFAQLASNVCSASFFCSVTFNVPATQRWAVESVSYQCTFPVGLNLVLLEIDIQRPDLSIQASYFPILDHGFDVGDGTRNAQSSQNLRFYADPGNSVRAGFQMSSNNSSTGCQATITGQAIDVP